MVTLLLIAFITPALYHLGARARLTRAIHSRYPVWLADFMHCAACAGAWYGAGAAAVFLYAGWSIAGSTSWWMAPVVGLMSTTWTPLGAAAQERALRGLHGELPAVTVHLHGAADDSPDN